MNFPCLSYHIVVLFLQCITKHFLVTRFLVAVSVHAFAWLISWENDTHDVYLHMNKFNNLSKDGKDKFSEMKKFPQIRQGKLRERVFLLISVLNECDYISGQLNIVCKLIEKSITLPKN